MISNSSPIWLSNFLIFEMLVAVCSLSVPGLLDEYEILRNNDWRRVFKLAVLVDVEDFNLTASLERKNWRDMFSCSYFRMNTSRNDLELRLDRGNHTSDDYETNCTGYIELSVEATQQSRVVADFVNETKYNITIKVHRKV